MEEVKQLVTQQGCWSNTEIQELIKILSILIEEQKSFGKVHSLESKLAYYRMKLEGKYSMAQIIHGLDKYTDKHNDIPAAADIINMLEPEKPRITTAQYIRACDAQKRNGYPAYSYESVLISNYENQASDEQEEFRIESKEIQKLVTNSVKRIEG